MDKVNIALGMFGMEAVPGKGQKGMMTNEFFAQSIRLRPGPL